MFWQMALRASVRLSVEPLEEGYPLGEIGLGPGVVEPAFARLAAGETGKRWLRHPRAETYLSERVALFQRLYR